MSGRMNARLIQLSLVLLISGISNTGAIAASPATAAQGDINMNELNILEHRFFSHSYAHDPAEKRLERLECLVFGSTREGNNVDRMGRLMKTVATRSAQPLAQDKTATAQAATPNAEAPPAAANSKLPATSKQYPILSTLEWKALKKTYPDESLDQRLDRLESKMFGQPAQTMAYIDRVERLKKTVGIGLTPEANDGITARGPMPKASSRGQEGEIGSIMPAPMQGAIPPAMMMPFGNIDPFGGTAFGGMQQLQQMQQMFSDMNKQMLDMGRSGGGNGITKSFRFDSNNNGVTQSLMFDPSKNEWVEMTPKNNRLGVPNEKPKATIPGDQQTIPLKDVPGYADPNSI